MIQTGSGGGWELSKRSDVKAGNIDWKGWYSAGRPTKVLTWWGSNGGLSARYSTERFAQISGASPEIYQNGELYVVAPGNVLGAALSRSGTDESIIAVCDGGGGTDVVYARPNERTTSPVLYDPVLEPRGWKELGRFPDPVGRSLGHNPWFFNGEGTEAQTIRRLDPSRPERLSRLKLQVFGGGASFSELGNLNGLRVTRDAVTTRQSEPPSPCEAGTEGTARVETKVDLRQDGAYVVAVDYRDDQEILATVVGSGTGRSFAAYSYQWKCGSDGRVRATDEKEEGEYSADLARELEFGSVRIPLDNHREEVLRSITWSDDSGALETGTLQRNQSKFSLEQLAFLDLRHDLWAGVEFSEPAVTTTVAYDDESKVQCTQHADLAKFTQLVEFGSERITISEDPQDYSQSYCQDGPSGWALDLTSRGPPSGTTFPGLGTMRNIIYPRSNPGSWIVSSAGKLAFSQDISGFGGVYNYLTGGDLSSAVPIDSGGNTFYPILLVR